jgi:hypothetical protein
LIQFHGGKIVFAFSEMAHCMEIDQRNVRIFLCLNFRRTMKI